MENMFNLGPLDATMIFPVLCLTGLAIWLWWVYRLVRDVIGPPPGYRAHTDLASWKRRP